LTLPGGLVYRKLMRLKTEFWVKAYIRRCAVQGAPAVVVRHGDDQAGAIFIKIVLPNRQALLFTPAPAGRSDADYDRHFVAWRGGARAAEEAVDDALAKETRFDSDLWVIEVEDRDGRHFLGDEIVSPA
jgi:hypothetical protein